MQKLKQNPEITTPEPTNAQIADVLEQMAAVLEVRSANPYRVGAYHAAAKTIREHDQPLAENESPREPDPAPPAMSALRRAA